jgi:predicted kinase
MHAPLLIVVTGRPGAGKTTLAHTLARTIRCPALCRDEFKEGFMHTVQAHAPLDAQVQWQVNTTFFRAIELLLRHDITLVAEAAFQHKLWAPQIEPLQALAQIRLVICALDPPLARTRVIQRGLADPERVRYHGDQVVQAARQGIALPISPYDPPRLAVPTLMVDTAAGYRPTLDHIVDFVMQPDGNTGDEPHP